LRFTPVLGARWSEVDTPNKLWIIPMARMKGGHEHRVPLCDRAVAIIEDMRAAKVSEYIFPGGKRGKPLSNIGLMTVLRRMDRGEIRARFSFHIQGLGR